MSLSDCNSTRARNVLVDLLKEKGIDCEKFWYQPIESNLSEEEIMEVAACCHGIQIGKGTASTLGTKRNCRQCGFVL